MSCDVDQSLNDGAEPAETVTEATKEERSNLLLTLTANAFPLTFTATEGTIAGGPDAARGCRSVVSFISPSRLISAPGQEGAAGRPLPTRGHRLDRLQWLLIQMHRSQCWPHLIG